MRIRNGDNRDDILIHEMGNKVLAHHAAFDSFYKPVKGDYVTPEPPEKLVFIAEDESGVALGYIQGIAHKTLQDRSYLFAVIQSIWVEESARGQGIATSLIATFESVVKERGIRQIDMFVDVRNESGLALWDAAGYETYQEKRRKFL